jgi:hypothetical protein
MSTYEIEGSVLSINGIDLPPFSARGITQSLEPIEQATYMERTIDGELDDLSLPQFRKYRSTIRGVTPHTPALDGVWPGQEVVVDCIKELSYRVPEGEDAEETLGDNAERTPVPDSIRILAGFVRYRPRLTMLLRSIRTEREEWGGPESWTLDFEEK